MKVELFYPNGSRGALSNICSDVVALRDICEDYGKAPDPLAKHVSDFTRRKWTVDRTKSDYVRLKNVDQLGNIKYLIISYQ